MLWCQPATLSNFSLSKSLKTFRCLKDYIFLFDFPKTISLWLDSYHHEINWDIWSFWNFFILLHQTDDQVCLLGYRDSELWIVKPSFISIVLWTWIFIFFIILSINWIWTTSGISCPFTIDRELIPCCWENFAEIDFIKVCAEIFIFHPPITIIFKGILKFFFESSSSSANLPVHSPYPQGFLILIN